MNFKDLQFSIGKFKADVSSQLAKNNPLQKQDTKTLSLWIFQERNDLASMRTMAYERSETNKALKQWVKEEVDEEKRENGRDLEDIVGDKLCRLFDKQHEIDQAYAAKYQQYRHAVKSIRDREEKLSDQREKKRSLQSRILNLSKTSPKSPKLLEFQQELKSLAHDTLESEMDLADFKRFALKEAFYIRFNALSEYAEKTALIAGFGKYLTDLIEIEPTPPAQMHRNPYKNGPEAAIIFADAVNALDNWKPSAEDERPTLANNADNKKGKSPVSPVDDAAKTNTDAAGSSSKIPPELPPRRPTQENIVVPTPSTPDAPSQPSGYTTNEITSVTGDLKTNAETEIDLDKIDLYDAPPPAYDGPPAQSSASPLNADAHLPPHQHQLQYTSQSFNSPYQAHANAPPPAPHQHHQQQPYSPHPSYINLTDSPVPMHQQQQQHFSPPHQHNPWSNPQHQYHQDSSFYDPTNMMYSQVNYQQLYRQVSQRQQHHAHRPYSEFQQQFNQDPRIGQQQRQRVDAGGFRIPTTNTVPGGTCSAEDEKERLAQHYKQQEEQYSNNISHYGGGSQYGGSAHSQQDHVAQQQAPYHQQQQQPSSPPAPAPISPLPPSHTVQQQTQAPNNYEQKYQEEE